MSGKANEFTFQNDKFHQSIAIHDIETLCSSVAFSSSLRVKNEN